MNNFPNLNKSTNSAGRSLQTSDTSAAILTSPTATVLSLSPMFYKFYHGNFLNYHLFNQYLRFHSINHYIDYWFNIIFSSYFLTFMSCDGSISSSSDEWFSFSVSSVKILIIISLHMLTLLHIQLRNSVIY
jgi:hypothetical protein